MKILFVKTLMGTSSLSFFDMGIGLMSAVLKQNGHDTKYFSVGSERDVGRLMWEISTYQPDVVAFTATESSYPSANKISKLIKKRHKNIYIVCGGVFVTLCPEVISRSTGFDAICQGEGEDALLDLVTMLSTKSSRNYNIEGWWFKTGKKIIKNPPRKNVVNINKLPFPDRKIFLDDGSLFWNAQDNPGRGIEFIFSRGCPFNCTYCCNHALNKFYSNRFVRYKDPVGAIAEIKEVMLNYRFDYFVFHDDTFTVNHKWMNEFLDLYMEIKVPFECNIRVDTVTEEILRKLKNAGCYIVRMGVESGDEQLRKMVLNRKMSNLQIEKAARLAKKNGLQTGAFLMIGLPGETKEKFMKTVELVSKLNVDHKDAYIFYPYKGTDLYNVSKREGYLKDSKSKHIQERRDTILNMPNFKRDEILHLHKNFDTLVELSKPGGGYITKWHKTYLLYLMSRTPLDWGYRLARFLWNTEISIKNIFS